MAWFLETERLGFRRYERSDLNFLSALLGDAELMHFIGAGRPVERPAAAEQLERHLEDEADRGWFLAVAKPTMQPVGHIALVLQNVEGHEDVEIGWCLARHVWGNGYATESGRAFRDYAFDAGGLTRVIHLIGSANVRSIGVAQRIGSRFERDAIFREQAVRVYAQTRS